ncbi:TAXI family TRAP transporter solute-binding subunit [Nocardiopsis sp. FIRDI 009]|uniref:TAXI family TRAP transporter solute-binding subunit n=1 Tax=Nocardiopsis sp. FIRDI 009 TaxID=714197 RepID=UPI000E2634B9|nr:TAXI family TRAP transporter solute-binding subunit [Nocardiopsis sp. FIRDI 009]
MRRAVPSLAALPVSVLLLASCAQPADQAAEEEAGIGQGAVREQLSIATGGSTGVYFPLGGALATVIEENIEGQTGSAETTGASVENLRLIGNGDADIAIVQGDAAGQAFEGTAEFEGSPVESYALAVLYPNVFHTVTLESTAEEEGLECFRDVLGTRYSVGAPGSGNRTTTTAVFAALEMSLGDIDIQNLGYAETDTALRNDQLDAGSWVVGQGHGGLTELATTEDVHLINMCDDEREAITAGTNSYTEHTIPGGTYPGVDEDVQTIAVWNSLVVGGEFNEDQAYEITAAMFDNIDTLLAAHAPAEEYLVPETILNSPVPVHPGAARFYEEQGIELPEELVAQTEG